jgi:hypothetical protein
MSNVLGVCTIYPDEDPCLVARGPVDIQHMKLHEAVLQDSSSVERVRGGLPADSSGHRPPAYQVVEQ